MTVSGSPAGPARSVWSASTGSRSASGQAAAGRNIDVWVTDQVLQFFDGDQLLRTQTARATPGEVRKKRASVPGGRRTSKTSVTDQPK